MNLRDRLNLLAPLPWTERLGTVYDANGCRVLSVLMTRGTHEAEQPVADLLMAMAGHAASSPTQQELGELHRLAQLGEFAERNALVSVNDRGELVGQPPAEAVEEALLERIRADPKLAASLHAQAFERAVERASRQVLEQMSARPVTLQFNVDTSKAQEAIANLRRNMEQLPRWDDARYGWK